MKGLQIEWRHLGSHWSGVRPGGGESNGTQGWLSPITLSALTVSEQGEHGCMFSLYMYLTTSLYKSSVWLIRSWTALKSEKGQSNWEMMMHWCGDIVLFQFQYNYYHRLGWAANQMILERSPDFSSWRKTRRWRCQVSPGVVTSVWGQWRGQEERLWGYDW